MLQIFVWAAPLHRLTADEATATVQRALADRVISEGWSTVTPFIDRLRALDLGIESHGFPVPESHWLHGLRFSQPTTGLAWLDVAWDTVAEAMPSVQTLAAQHRVITFAPDLRLVVNPDDPAVDWSGVVKAQYERADEVMAFWHEDPTLHLAAEAADAEMNAINESETESRPAGPSD